MKLNAIERLVAEFSDAATKYYASTMEGDSQSVNQQSLRMTSLFKQLIEYGDPGREALLSLINSAVPAIAQMSATYSLKYAPEKCKKVLTALTQTPGVIGFGASQTLLRWEEGEWRLEE